jgi:hypothetical protein
MLPESAFCKCSAEAARGCRSGTPADHRRRLSTLPAAVARKALRMRSAEVHTLRNAVARPSPPRPPKCLPGLQVSGGGAGGTRTHGQGIMRSSDHGDLASTYDYVHRSTYPRSLLSTDQRHFAPRTAPHQPIRVPHPHLPMKVRPYELLVRRGHRRPLSWSGLSLAACRQAAKRCGREGPHSAPPVSAKPTRNAIARRQWHRSMTRRQPRNNQPRSGQHRVQR